MAQTFRIFGRDNGKTVVEFLDGSKLYCTDDELAKLQGGGSELKTNDSKAAQEPVVEDKAVSGPKK